MTAPFFSTAKEGDTHQMILGQTGQGKSVLLLVEAKRLGIIKAAK